MNTLTVLATASLAVGVAMGLSCADIVDADFNNVHPIASSDPAGLDTATSGSSRDGAAGELGDDDGSIANGAAGGSNEADVSSTNSRPSAGLDPSESNDGGGEGARSGAGDPSDVGNAAREDGGPVTGGIDDASSDRVGAGADGASSADAGAPTDAGAPADAEELDCSPDGPSGADAASEDGGMLVKPTVITGAASEIGPTHARLGVTVTDKGKSTLYECGVCWGPLGASLDLVETATLGPGGVRCMRQIPCLSAAYYTNDGFMDQREYALGTTYAYRGYAVSGAGVSYGATMTFSTPEASQCIYRITELCWITNSQLVLYTVPLACGDSMVDAYQRTLPIGYHDCAQSQTVSCCTFRSGSVISD